MRRALLITTVHIGTLLVGTQAARDPFADLLNRPFYNNGQNQFAGNDASSAVTTSSDPAGAYSNTDLSRQQLTQTAFSGAGLQTSAEGLAAGGPASSTGLLSSEEEARKKAWIHSQLYGEPAQQAVALPGRAAPSSRRGFSSPSYYALAPDLDPGQSQIYAAGPSDASFLQDIEGSKRGFAAAEGSVFLNVDPHAPLPAPPPVPKLVKQWEKLASAATQVSAVLPQSQEELQSRFSTTQLTTSLTNASKALNTIATNVLDKTASPEVKQVATQVQSFQAQNPLDAQAAPKVLASLQTDTSKVQADWQAQQAAAQGAIDKAQKQFLSNLGLPPATNSGEVAAADAAAAAHSTGQAAVLTGVNSATPAGAPTAAINATAERSGGQAVPPATTAIPTQKASPQPGSLGALNPFASGAASIFPLPTAQPVALPANPLTSLLSADPTAGVTQTADAAPRMPDFLTALQG